MPTHAKQQPGMTHAGQKAAEHAYRATASSTRPPFEKPWEELDAGTVLWNDFSKTEQEAVARHYAPKVKYIALRLKTRLPRSVDVNDLMSAGSMGLVESFSKFRPDMGVKFDTYAENRIRGAMLDELRRLDWFPRSLRQRVRQLDAAIMQEEQSSGRTPSEEELAAITGLTTQEVREGLEAMQSQAVCTLDGLENVLTGENDAHDQESPFGKTAVKELLGKVAGLVDQLTPREKLVLSLYYAEELNMREAAEVMGVTEGRVSQLHSQALGRLRREFHAQYGASGEVR